MNINEKSATGSPDSAASNNLENPEGDAMQPEEQLSDFLIFKNLMCISLAFVITLTATNALGILQSSINSDAGLGTATLSVTFASTVVSSIFLPTFIIKQFGCKWTMAVAALGASAAVAANLKPIWATMIPMAVVFGTGNALLWSAQSVYVTRLAKMYAVRHKKSFEATTNIFFGIFFTMYQTTQIWGNLLSAKLLQPQGNSSSQGFSNARLEVCGIEYCNEDLDSLDLPNVTISGKASAGIVSQSNQQDPQLRLLLEVYLGMTLLSALLLAIAVNPLPKSKEVGAPIVSGLSLVVATFRQFGNKLQTLLMPLSLYRGLGEAFLSADYTKAFVMCTLGIQNIGLVAICFGVVASLASLMYGFLVKRVGRVPVFTFAAACNFTSMAMMFAIHPSPDRLVPIYVMPAIWAISDACWSSQVTAMYGYLFYDNLEAAFSCYRLADSMGFIIGFSWSSYLCMWTKLWIILGIYCIGLIGYFTVECITYFNSRQCIAISVSKPSASVIKIESYKSTSMLCKNDSYC